MPCLLLYIRWNALSTRHVATTCWAGTRPPLTLGTCPSASMVKSPFSKSKRQSSPRSLPGGGAGATGRRATGSGTVGNRAISVITSESGAHRPGRPGHRHPRLTSPTSSPASPGPTRQTRSLQPPQDTRRGTDPDDEHSVPRPQGLDRIDQGMLVFPVSMAAVIADIRWWHARRIRLEQASQEGLDHVVRAPRPRHPGPRVRLQVWRGRLADERTELDLRPLPSSLAADRPLDHRCQARASVTGDDVHFVLPPLLPWSLRYSGWKRRTSYPLMTPPTQMRDGDDEPPSSITSPPEPKYIWMW